MNYIDQQEYNRAIQQLQYYQAIKEHYDLMMQEERTIQELDYLKRYANEVVYPAIDKARKVKEDYLRSEEQREKRKQEQKEFKHEEWNYNRECRKNELYKLVDDGKRMEVSIWRRLSPELEDKE